MSPMCHAADNDHYDICKYLLDMGANIDIRSCGDKCAYDLANTSISKLFIRYGFNLKSYVRYRRNNSKIIDVLIDIIEDFAES